MTMTSKTTKALYYTALGLFTVLFLGSVLLSIVDPQGTIEEYRRLSFPEWLLIPQIITKTLGLIALFQNRWRLLKDFAFAGFLYNLLLAVGGHLAVREADIALAIVGLILWAFAFTMDRIHYPREADTGAPVGRKAQNQRAELTR